MTETSPADWPSGDQPPQALVELSRLQLGEQSLGQTLQRVAEIARGAVPPVADASVTLIEHNRVKTVAFTGRLAVDLDERQYESGRGPCLDAATTGERVVVSTDDPDSPYPEFQAAARRAGITHVVSLGLPLPARTVGGLNVYAGGPDAFDEDALRVLGTFASYAAVAVANAALYSSTAELARQMQIAVQSRGVIDQAKGIVMAQQRCSSEAAFEALVKLSQRQNVKLRDVAQRIVDRIQGC